MPEFHTASLWINIVIFIAGFWLLIKGSDWFVDSAASLARTWHVSELIIGLTLVSIGTSLPELASSIYASAHNMPKFAFGNVIGSITTNITLILGLCAAIGAPICFARKLFTRDAVLMNLIFGVMILFFVFTVLHIDVGPGKFLMSYHALDWWAGIVFLLGAVAYCIYLFKHPKELCEEFPDAGVCHAESPIETAPMWRSCLFLVLGFVMLFAGSKALLDTVVWGAEELEISPTVVAATVVAFGTSVPELAVSLSGVLKGRHDIAVGNIVGSNIFNVLLIFGVVPLICPLPLNGFVAHIGGIPDDWIHLTFMMVAGLLLLAFMAMTGSLRRWQGIALLTIYLAYLAFNISVAQPTGVQ